VALLADGSWAMLRTSADAAMAERAWLKRNLPEPPRNRPTRWMAALALRQFAARLLQRRRAAVLVVVVGAVLLAAGVGAAATGWLVAGFALVALGVFAGELSTGVSRLVAAPFEPDKRMRLISVASELAVDLSLTACAVLAIQQDALHRFFPPLVLVGLLRTLRPESWSGAKALLGDRLLLAFVLAIAAALGVTETAVMGLALLAIVLEAAQTLKRRG
jgi:hypothetical protein